VTGSCCGYNNANSHPGLIAAHDIAHQPQHRLLHEVPKLDDATVHVSTEGTEGTEGRDEPQSHRPPLPDPHRHDPLKKCAVSGGFAAEEGGAAVELGEAVEERPGVGEGVGVGADHG